MGNSKNTPSRHFVCGGVKIYFSFERAEGGNMKLVDALKKFEECRKALGHSNLSGDIIAGKDDMETLVAYAMALRENLEATPSNEIRGVVPVIDLIRMRVEHTTCTGSTHIWVEVGQYGDWSILASRVDGDHPWDILREDHLKIIALAGYTERSLHSNSSQALELEGCFTDFLKPSSTHAWSGQFENDVTRLKNELAIKAGELLQNSPDIICLPDCVEMDKERDPTDSEPEFFLNCKEEELYAFLMQHGSTILAYAAKNNATKVGIYWAY